MPADHDHELQDELLRRVVAELRRPVRLDPGVDARALRAIHDAERRGAWALPNRRRLPLAGAALAAGLLVMVMLRMPSGADPVVSAPVASAAPETRPVRLHLSAPASSVAVVGDFNDWDPSATPLRPTKEGDIWSVELRLRPGRYHYSFLIDGRRWKGDPSEPRASDSDFGAPVSVLTVS
jgi:hypothetical protein